MGSDATIQPMRPIPASRSRAERGDEAAIARRRWIDNLKVLLIGLIIAVHGVLSYSGTLEAWNYSEFREVSLHPATEAVLFVVVTPLAFLMIPLLFLVAGLLTPGSVRRKGVRTFVADRLLRLGVPFVVFVFVLEPVLTYALEHPLGDAPGSWWEEYFGAERRADTGPLWFVGVLLVFSLAYAGWVTLRGRSGLRAARGRAVTVRGLLMLAGVVAVASFLVRLIYPYGSEAGVTDMQFWEWPGCLAAFGLGLAGHRLGWLERVPPELGRRCRTVTLVALAALAALFLYAGATDRIEEGLGGWHLLAVAFAVFEAPLVVTGPIWLVGVSQRRLDRGYRSAVALTRSCYGAFILQGFVLIGLAAALRPVGAAAEVKALVVAVAGVAGSFLLSWLVVHLPGVRRVI